MIHKTSRLTVSRTLDSLFHRNKTDIKVGCLEQTYTNGSDKVIAWNKHIVVSVKSNLRVKPLSDSVDLNRF